MKHPIVGITFDWKEQGDYSKYPWYAVRQHYCDAVAHAGGLPIVLPYQQDKIPSYLDYIDALLITGGDFDIDPSFYGQEKEHERVETIPHRTQFEFDLTRQAIRQEMPILGICGGHQLLNVIAGGSLIQHIPEAIQTEIEHEQPNPRHETGHGVEVHPSSKLFDVIQTAQIDVNSAHHQAVDTVAPGFIVNARAPDGVIEGIEHTDHPFCMGVQWHPEFYITEADKKIFKAFIEAAL